MRIEVSDLDRNYTWPQQCPIVGDFNMSDKILKIAIVVNIIPNYREGFYDRLFSRKDLLVKVYCQDRIPGMNLKTIHNKYPNNVKLLKYFSAKREKLSWQFIPWREVLIGYDVVFVEGNPRNLSHAILASYLRLFRKKVVLWTMAHSFRGYALTENLRLLWSRIFDSLFVYTDAEVDFLRRKGFKNNYIVSMNNGLDQKNIDATILMWPEKRLQEWRIAHKLENRTLLLSCARLEQKNRFDQVVRALPTIIKHIPTILWCVIGSGSELNRLKNAVNADCLFKHVHFVGELYCEKELAPWYLSSEIFLHPAAAGLSILHAFGYGLPVVINDNKYAHGPEYGAFEQARTGWTFHENNVRHLSETIINLLNDDEARKSMKSYVHKVTREKYNVDVMVERFVQIAKIAANK